MMVILTMLMMKRITSMTMTEIMMVMTMMVVMFHITDFLLKRRKRNRFVCLFFQIICMSDSQLFKRKLLMELIINPLGFHCFLRDKKCKETTRQVERVSIPGFRLECRIRNREVIETVFIEYFAIRCPETMMQCNTCKCRMPVHRRDQTPA